MSIQSACTVAGNRPFFESRNLMDELEDDLTDDEAMATHDQIERLPDEKERELLRANDASALRREGGA